VPEVVEHQYSDGRCGPVPIVRYLASSTLTADEAFTKTETKQDEGMAFIEKYLADGQWHQSAEFWKAAEAKGFTERTLRRSLADIRAKIAYEKVERRQYMRLVVSGINPLPPLSDEVAGHDRIV
jgi:hypothetical protein